MPKTHHGESIVLASSNAGKVREINERNIQETEARIERFRAKYAEVAPA